MAKYHTIRVTREAFKALHAIRDRLSKKFADSFGGEGRLTLSQTLIGCVKQAAEAEEALDRAWNDGFEQATRRTWTTAMALLFACVTDQLRRLPGDAFKGQVKFLFEPNFKSIAIVDENDATLRIEIAQMLESELIQSVASAFLQGEGKVEEIPGRELAVPPMPASPLKVLEA